MGECQGECVTELSLLSSFLVLTHLQFVFSNVLQVTSIGKPHRLRNLKDTSSSNSLFFLSLVEAIDARAVDPAIITPGVSVTDKDSNAKYAISCARKVGALVFLTFEDIVETKSKMIMTLLSSLWTIDMERGGR